MPADSQSEPPVDDATTPEPLLLRHLVPVVVGGVATLALTIVTDNSLRGHEVLPGPGQPVVHTSTLWLMLAYRAVFAGVGCHLAARLAPLGQPRMRYALGLGFVLMALAGIGALMIREQVPTWYSLCSIALTIPAAILGGGTAARATGGRGSQGNRRP
jgi:hypothetical protein